MINSLKKIGNLVSDPRMPWHIPVQMLKNKKIKTLEINGNEPINFCLTVDFEKDYGSGRKDYSIEKTSIFTRQFTKLSHGIRGDIFVQGDLVEKFRNELENLQYMGFNLGLHGLHHELWGKPHWFNTDKYISVDTRRERLEKSFFLFEKCGFARPVSFRAPNMIIDADTLNLLNEFGFESDSSAASFLGIKPIISFNRKLGRIPVSADPRAKLRTKGGIPFSEFKVFNYHNLTNLSNEQIIDMIKRITGFQKALSKPLHLIFLMHSWELSNEDELELFMKKLALIENSFNINYVTMKELSSLHENI